MAISPSKPWLPSVLLYSERLVASSLIVPLRKTSMTRQPSLVSRSR